MTFSADGAIPVVLSAPSGVGKSTLARVLAKRRSDVVVAVSVTTRPPRPGETAGFDYHFVDDLEFDRMLGAGELAEWAVVHDRRYGTPYHEIEAGMASGKKVLLDIDVQGARRIRARFPQNVSVFILPPSGRELARRLAGRGSEVPEVQRQRLLAAQHELTAAIEFDYIVVNDRLDRALAELDAILIACERQVARIVGLDEQLNRLSRELEAILERNN